MAKQKRVRIAYDLSRVSEDAPDSVIMAELRNANVPGSDLDGYADALAADLAAHGRITRATCAALARSASNLQAMTILGYEAPEILAVLGFAAAKLEMQMSADG